MPTDLTQAAADIASRPTARRMPRLKWRWRPPPPANRHTFMRRFEAQRPRHCAGGRRAARRRRADAALAGLAVSIKDLFDVAGQPTTAASRSHARRAPWHCDGLPGGGAFAQRRRRADRSHQPDRIRVLGRGHQPASRHARQPGDCGARRVAAHPRRFDLGRRGVGGHRCRVGGARLRHRRLDPHSGGIAGPGRLQVHGAAGADRPGASHCRPTLDTGCRDHPFGARRGGAARGACSAPRGAAIRGRCRPGAWPCRVR